MASSKHLLKLARQENDRLRNALAAAQDRPDLQNPFPTGQPVVSALALEAGREINDRNVEIHNLKDKVLRLQSDVNTQERMLESYETQIKDLSHVSGQLSEAIAETEQWEKTCETLTTKLMAANADVIMQESSYAALESALDGEKLHSAELGRHLQIAEQLLEETGGNEDVTFKPEDLAEGLSAMAGSDD